MSVLNRILKTKQEEVTERKNRISERDLMSTLLAGRQRLSMRKALEESATGIIAEFKRKSPSGGFIHEAAGVQEVVGGYVRNGAAACSVLTDTDYFGGSLLDLAMARRVSDIPLLRKDFIVDSYQLAEAVAYGADAVLLIAAALSPAQCRELADAAHGLGLEILLEIHREEELEYVSPEMDMVGINNRNLTTFETDIYTSFRLASQVPVACPRALERLPAAIGKVGVFVNAETGFIENIVRRYRMDTIQLHGDEPPEMGHYFVRKGYRVIKAFGIEEAGDFQRTLPYESACQLFLFDTRSRQFGGTGKSFDWNLLNRYEGSVPFFLSGGIAWENREEIGKIKHPKLAGLDLNSRFETAPGMKNIHLLSRFLAELP